MQATAFSSYGAFWISYAITISPWSGVADAYAEASDPNMEANGVSFFLWGCKLLASRVASL